jgi:hypothetical protein
VASEPWSPSEDDLLRQLYGIYCDKWVIISMNLPHRSERAVKSRWKILSQQASPEPAPPPPLRLPVISPSIPDDQPESYLDSKFGKWTADDDETLRLLNVAHPGDWRFIAEFFPGRSPRAIRARAGRLPPPPPAHPKHPNLPSKPAQKWLPDEDDSLREGVAIYGDSDWDLVSSEVPLRRPKECRERWAKLVAQGMPTTHAWAPAEDETLRRLHAKWGNKWGRMLAELPGREWHEVKKRWEILAGRDRDMGIVPEVVESAPKTPRRKPKKKKPAPPKQTVAMQPKQTGAVQPKPLFDEWRMLETFGQLSF